VGRGKKNQKRNQGTAPLAGRQPKRLGRIPRTPAWLLDQVFLYGRLPAPLSEEEKLLQAESRRLAERDRLLYAGHSSPVSRFRYQGGRLLFQRLGNLNPVRQDLGFTKDFAPERRGIWAFPWPAGDIGFFAGHKWDEVVPKRLRFATTGPLWEDYYERRRSGALAPEEGERLLAELTALDEERERWIREQGPKAMPMRQFWFDGELYARINLQGEFMGGGRASWQRLSVSQFVLAARKSALGYGTDHLEVFIPRL